MTLQAGVYKWELANQQREEYAHGIPPLTTSNDDDLCPVEINVTISEDFARHISRLQDYLVITLNDNRHVDENAQGFVNSLSVIFNDFVIDAANDGYVSEQAIMRVFNDGYALELRNHVTETKYTLDLSHDLLVSEPELTP